MPALLDQKLNRASRLKPRDEGVTILWPGFSPITLSHRASPSSCTYPVQQAQDGWVKPKAPPTQSPCPKMVNWREVWNYPDLPGLSWSVSAITASFKRIATCPDLKETLINGQSQLWSPSLASLIGKEGQGSSICGKPYAFNNPDHILRWN